jgi:hypothetical protein
MLLARNALLAAAVLALGCSSEPSPPDPGDALYAAEFDPAILVYATPACDRFLNHGVLSLSRRVHSFDLSVNLFDDCSRAGGGFAFWEVLILGTYTYRDSVVRFTPTSGATPPFTAVFDGQYMRVTLPARSDSLGAAPVLIHLGPREAF